MRKMEVLLDGQVFEIEFDPSSLCRSALLLQVDGTEVQVLIHNLDGDADEHYRLSIDGRPYELTFDSDLHRIQDASGVHEVKIRETRSQDAGVSGKPGPVKAPIPGQITRLLVSPGEIVEAGQPLLILEAMKMHNEIFAQAPGVVHAVRVSPGENVKLGEVLVEISSRGQDK